MGSGYSARAALTRSGLLCAHVRSMKWRFETLAAMVGMLAAGVPAANAAGIVTHAWMALEAIDRVQPPALRQLLDAHRDQVRAGAEFPDGGYWTRSFGTPGGDYGEEAHWQRFHDAYVAQIRSD